MRKFILLITLFFSCEFTFGQSAQSSIKYPVKGKQVIIDAQETSLVIEGYDGDEMIIEAAVPVLEPKIPSDAQGLSLIASTIEKEDNTILFNVLKDEPNLFSIKLLKSKCRHLHIKIPKNAHLKFSFLAGSPDTKVLLKGLSGELEVDGSAPVIEFIDITGPLTLSAAETGFKAGASEKIILTHLRVPKDNVTSNDKDIPFLNIITSYADVDISLPQDTKATIQVDTRFGDLFSDLDIVTQRPAFPPVMNRYTGNLNGGGKMIVINAAYGNVYIRKQK